MDGVELSDDIRNIQEIRRETGIPGVTVQLRDIFGTVVGTDTTDGTGTYGFSDLDGGVYNVTIDTGTELVILSNGAGLNVEVPLKLTYNPKPAGFIFANSGFSFQNLARNVTGGSYNDSNLAFPIGVRNQVFLPLEVGGGYTHVVKNIVMMDFFARVGWNPFVYLNAPSGVSVVPVRDSWILAVGVILHTSPVLQQ